MKIIVSTLLLATYFVCGVMYMKNELKSLSVKYELDLAESRKREEGILAYLNVLKHKNELLDYQIDVVVGKDAK